MQGLMNCPRRNAPNWRMESEGNPTMNPSLRALINRVQFTAFLIGVIRVSCCVVGIVMKRHQFFISYLFAYLFWLGLALGCFSVTMIHYLTGGRWGYPSRRCFEAGMGTLPVLAL